MESLKFHAMRDGIGVLRLRTTLCGNHFSARWIDELIHDDPTDNWVDVTKIPLIKCQICGAVPAPDCTDYYVCGNIKVPRR